MIIAIMKSSFFLLFFFPVIILSTGCVCLTNKKELDVKNEKIKNMELELLHKEEIMHDLLKSISIKDQEVGRLSQELQNAQLTIEDLRSSIQKLREVDVLVEEKKKKGDNHNNIETIPADTEMVMPGTDSVTREK